MLKNLRLFAKIAGRANSNNYSVFANLTADSLYCMLQPFSQLMANFYRAGTCIIKRFYDACQEELARECIALTSNNTAHPGRINKARNGVI